MRVNRRGQPTPVRYAKCVTVSLTDEQYQALTDWGQSIDVARAPLVRKLILGALEARKAETSNGS